MVAVSSPSSSPDRQVLLSHKFFRVISSRREIVDGGAISFFFVVDVARIERLGGPDSMFYNVHTSK